MSTLASVLAWLEQAPPETLMPARAVLTLLRDAGASADDPGATHQHTASADATWRSQLWTVPSETRLGVAELAEALGRPESWVYRHTSSKSGYEQLPHRRLDGLLVFRADEIRTWIADHEDVIVRAPTAVVPITRRKVNR